MESIVAVPLINRRTRRHCCGWRICGSAGTVLGSNFTARLLSRHPHLQVRFGQQKRYQDWFQRQYLSTPDSQSLRCDLIRYICGVVHPSNEVLSSDILPRWAIIGWLLTTCTVRALGRPIGAWVGGLTLT